jgi:hypothetical protein
VPSHETSAGISITSFAASSDWAALPFGLRHLRILSGDGTDVPAGTDYGPTNSGPDGLTLLESCETFAGFSAVLDEKLHTDEGRRQIERVVAARAPTDQEAS